MSLSQTATVLVVVFTFCLVAVTAQLAYVLWWKRRFHCRSVAGSEPDAFSSRGGDPTATPPPSKELLYFFLFCIENKQFRIGTATAPPLPAAAPPIDDVASKWSVGGENLLCGPSETLFTIAEDCTNEADHKTDEIESRGSISSEDHVKDDELEEGFVVTDRSDDELEEGFVVTDRSEDELEEGFVMTDRSDDELEEGFVVTDRRDNELEEGSVVTDRIDDELEEGFVVTDRSVNEVDSSDYNHDGTTPFSTPCSSPRFYTPSPSPIRDDRSKTQSEERLYPEIV